MGTFTVSTLMETVNVPIIGLAQARVSGRVSVLFGRACFFARPNRTETRPRAPSGSDPPAASRPPLPTLRAATSLMRTVRLLHSRCELWPRGRARRLLLEVDSRAVERQHADLATEYSLDGSQAIALVTCHQ